MIWCAADSRAGRAIRLTSLDDLPPEALAGRQLLESQQIQSLLVPPLVRRSRLEGFAGVDPIRGQRLQRLAYVDPLTGLPNRTLLSQRLDQALQRNTVAGRLLAVCFLDLDAFKAVNDAHGHAVGDQLLVVIAQRLQQCLRPIDTVGRMGGDEFILIFPELESRDQLRQLGQACLDAITQPCLLRGTAVVSLTTSLGVRLVPAGDAVDADTLLRQADQAMYAAKRQGPGRIHLFDVELERHQQQRLQGIDAIRAAIANGEMVLDAQPIAELDSGRVRSLEALVRWQHPTRGLLAPGEWLPLLEDHPAQVELGAWVLAEALRHWRSWRAAGLSIGIHVNVSALELADPRFVEQLATLLGDAAPGQHGLVLEVLESASFRHTGRMVATMQRCQPLGVRFALDDFGTGYSSLRHLRELPLSTLKIDRSFVEAMLREPADRAIVKGVVEMARAFGHDCVAEGVTTAAQVALLRELGCTYGQGYGLARPMPIPQVPAWMASQGGVVSMPA